MRWTGILQGFRSVLPYLSRRIDREGINLHADIQLLNLGSLPDASIPIRCQKLQRLAYFFDAFATTTDSAPNQT